MEIRDLIEGQSVEGLVGVVESQSTARTKSDKPFLRLKIQDKTGAIEGVMWDFDPDSFGWLKEGVVVAVNADVGSYNGAQQLKYAAVFHAPNLDSSAFGKSTKFDVEKLWTELVDTIGTFKEPLTKYVAEELLTKQGEIVAAMKRAPAAKGVHNAWFGGLLEHIWSLCQIAEPVIKHYQTHYESRISRDKVLFGLMLHDAGKIIEYDFSGARIGYSGLGILANHMVLGPAWVFEAANRWWAQERVLQTGEHKAGPQTNWDGTWFKFERAQLMHVLAAHHGKVEWGSPVAPATLEAVLVHQLDYIDSKMLHALDFVQGKEGATPGFGERSFFEKVNYMQYPKE